LLRRVRVARARAGAARPAGGGAPAAPGALAPAVGATEDAQPGRIDPVETLAGGVDAGHHVVEVGATPPGAGIALTLGPPHRPAPLLAVTGTSARVGVEDAEPGGGLELELIHEPVAVLRERSAVHVRQRRGCLARAGAGRRAESPSTPPHCRRRSGRRTAAESRG